MNHRNNRFPDSLNLSNIILVYKKLDPSDKDNYRPVSFLPLSLKVLEKNYLWSALWIYGKLKLCSGYYVVSKKYIPQYIDSGDYAGAICLKPICLMTIYHKNYWLQN